MVQVIVIEYVHKMHNVNSEVHVVGAQRVVVEGEPCEGKLFKKEVGVQVDMKELEQVDIGKQEKLVKHEKRVGAGEGGGAGGSARGDG